VRTKAYKGSGAVFATHRLLISVATDLGLREDERFDIMPTLIGRFAIYALASGEMPDKVQSEAAKKLLDALRLKKSEVKEFVEFFIRFVQSSAVSPIHFMLCGSHLIFGEETFGQIVQAPTSEFAGVVQELFPSIECKMLKETLRLENRIDQHRRRLSHAESQWLNLMLQWRGRRRVQRRLVQKLENPFLPVRYRYPYC
jgi:hypothetical protein